MTNAEIAEHFSMLSKLIDIHGENAFKSQTYSIAAHHIDKIERPLSEISQIEIASMKGLGSSIASKVCELIETGALSALRELNESTPQGVKEMLLIKGLGPKKINTVWKEMGILSIGELEYACMENRLTLCKGFGAKTQANVLEAIQFYKQNIGNYLYAQVAQVFPTVQTYLETLFGKENILSTGDYRRQQLIVKELEFVINATPEQIKPQFQTAYPPEIIEETNDQIVYKLANGLNLRAYYGNDLFFQTQFITSASTNFLTEFETRLPKEKLLADNYFSERDIFDAASIPYIEPYLRETASIIKKSENTSLPKVIEVADIKGIIHNHSSWSDGANTIEELALELIKNKFEYLVISDHSKTAAYANGLSEEKVAQQHAYINELNKKLAPFKIFKSIESDILNDGSLDFNNEILDSFDLVIASVHSNLYMQEDKAMQRLMAAIENPYTTILGHLTGRLLLSRNGYPINHKKIIDACAANRVVIEINANPHRLDMDWKWIEYAMEKNVLLSINPDAHSIKGLHDIQYGVLASQKGGLTAANNLSSFSLSEFEQFLQKTKTEKRHSSKINHP